MKRLILVFFLFSGLIAKSQCDSVSTANTTISSITQTSIVVTWTAAAGAIQYAVFLQQEGSSSSALYYTTLLTYNVTGLLPNTRYNIKIITYCNSGVTNQPTITKSFTTAITPVIITASYTQMNATGYTNKRVSVDSTFHVPFQDTGLYRGLTRPGALVISKNDSSFWGWNGRKWAQVGNASKQISDSLQDFVRLQTQNPTAIINPSLSYERRPSGFFTQSFDWTIGREARTANNKATDSILTVNVDGFNRAFTQPAAGATFTGSTNVNITWNVNKRVNLIVTTKDSKTATAFADVTVYDKRYIGWATTATPTDAEIRAAIAQDNSGGSGNYSANLPQLGTAQYLFYANTVTTSSVVLNGFPSTAAFTLNQSRTFTNSVGGATTYYVTVINAPTGNVGATSVTFN